jgi:hypothetical protein
VFLLVAQLITQAQAVGVAEILQVVRQETVALQAKHQAQETQASITVRAVAELKAHQPLAVRARLALLT